MPNMDFPGQTVRRRAKRFDVPAVLVGGGLLGGAAAALVVAFFRILPI